MTQQKAPRAAGQDNKDAEILPEAAAVVKGNGAANIDRRTADTLAALSDLGIESTLTKKTYQKYRTSVPVIPRTASVLLFVLLPCQE